MRLGKDGESKRTAALIFTQLTKGHLMIMALVKTRVSSLWAKEEMSTDQLSHWAESCPPSPPTKYWHPYRRIASYLNKYQCRGVAGTPPQQLRVGAS